MEPRQPRRFVVQYHDLSAGGHWDLMLEQDESLATWQLSAPPEVALDGPVAARRIADHRKAYLDYEGAVSGGRGRVQIADSGEYMTLKTDEGEWVVDLHGRILRGRFRLARMSERDEWLFLPSGVADP